MKVKEFVAEYNERQKRWAEVMSLPDLVYVVIAKTKGDGTVGRDRVQVLKVPRKREMKRLLKKHWGVVGVVRDTDENPEDVLLGLVLAGTKAE